MKLHSLEIYNFRQHVESKFCFESGLTAIIGPNGAGKSTILEAIAFAMFGSQAIRGKIEDLRTRGVSKSEPVFVQLSFELESGIYRIERGLTDAKLFFGGQEAASVTGNSEVVLTITQLLGMNYKEFLAAYFTEQKGLEFLSGQRGAAERERFIIKMMGLDRLENVHELLRQDRRVKKSELSGLEAGLGERENLAQRLLLETNETKRIESEYAEAMRVLENAANEAQKNREIFQRLEAKREIHKKLNLSAREVEVRYEERVRRLKELEIEHRAILGQNLEQSDLAAVNSEMSMLESELTRLSLEASSIELAWKEKLAGLNAEERIIQHKIDELQSKLNSYKSLRPGTKCPTCEQDLGDNFASVRDHFASEMELQEERLAMLRLQLTQLEQSPEELLMRQRKIAELQERQGILTLKLSQTRERLVALPRIESEIEGLRGEIVRLGQELKISKARVIELRFNEDEFTKTKLSHETTARLEEATRLQKIRIEGDLKSKTELIKRSRHDLEEYDRKASRLQGAKREAIVFEESDRVLTSFRKYLNSSIRPRLSQLASEFLAELTDGRYNAVELGVDFSPTVLEDGEAKPVISGGEQDILNLCLRLALSNMLAERAGHQLSLLILDEVFGSLDETRRQNVLALLERLNGMFDQIIIITHLEDVREGVRNIVYLNYNEESGRADLGLANSLDIPVGY